MAHVSLNNGTTKIDCSDLTDEQAHLVEEHIVAWSESGGLVDEIREHVHGSVDTRREFVAAFCTEYTRRTGEVVTLP